MSVDLEAGQITSKAFMKQVEAEGSEFLKCHTTSLIIKTDLKLVKDTSTSEHIKTDTKPLRKAHGNLHFPWANVHRELVNIRRNKTSITHNNHPPSAPCPVDAEAVCFIDAQNSKDGSRNQPGPRLCGSEE